MKNTKDIAELFIAEIERVSKGEVRKDVIMGLEKCTSALIKLARLEMDFAWKNWESQKPAVPWLATVAAPREIDADSPTPKAIGEHGSDDGEDLDEGEIIQRIKDCNAQIPTASPTLKAILADKLKKLNRQLREVRTG